MNSGLKESIQEHEYDFPYHHLPRFEKKGFTQTATMRWGYKYAAYVEKVLDTLGRIEPGPVIDIGTGDGRVAIEVAKRFPGRRVVGVDYSQKALRFAQAFGPDIEFKTHTAEQFPVFLLIEVIEHIDPERMDEFLDGICKNLLPSALGIITTPTVNIACHEKHYQHFTESSFRTTLEKHFVIESVEFTCKKSRLFSYLERIMENRYFILNHRPTLTRIYNHYKTHYLAAAPENGTALFALVRKK